MLSLFKDEGIYVMSPGYEPGKPLGPDSRAPTAYAVGFHPRRENRMEVWDRTLAAQPSAAATPGDMPFEPPRRVCACAPCGDSF